LNLGAAIEPDLCSALAKAWERETKQVLKAEAFEPLLGQLCDTAERRRVKPEALFAHAVNAFSTNLASSGKQPVLSWLVTQLGQWLAAPMPDKTANGSAKHHTMSELTPAQQRDLDEYKKSTRLA